MPSKPYNERMCAVCGKIFVIHYEDSWAYKITFCNTRYICCSWSCLRKKEKELQGKKTRRGRRKKNGGD